MLEPYRATACDLSLEKYIGEASYAALALFYKDLESYVYQQNIPDWDFSDLRPDNGITPISNFGNFSTWANGSGGYMRGVELGGALAGDLFHPALQGFGTQLNASYTEIVDRPGPERRQPRHRHHPGPVQNRRQRDLVLREARLFRTRQPTLPQRISRRVQRVVRTAAGPVHQAGAQIDLQFSYDFPDNSRMSGLTLLLQVNNLDNEPFRTEVSEATGTTGGLFLPEEYTEYGRQYLVGFRYDL